MVERRMSRRFAATVLLFFTLFLQGFGLTAADAADETSQTDSVAPSTATLQDVLPLTGDLYVVFGGRRISALPARLRVDDQASPLAYSLDLRRPAEYGDRWTGAAVIPNSDGTFPTNFTGVRNIELATVVARGSLNSRLIPPDGDLEYAARQIAIWSLTSQLQVNPSSVPNRAVRQRALALLDLAGKDATFPIQLSSHGVSIYLRSVSGNTVTLSVKLELEANRRLQDPADVDISLDGQLISVRTGEETRVTGAAGSYRVDGATPLPALPDDDPDKAGPNNFANIVLDRNTSVVDVTANWVNVTATPGLLFLADGASAPMLTADETVLNINDGNSTSLDPADYGGPAELVNAAATWVFAHLPTWLLWLSLFAFLYVVSRAGVIGDAFLRLLAAPFRRPWDRRHANETSHNVRCVRIEGPTTERAIASATALLGTDRPVDVRVVQLEKRRLLRLDLPAIVEVSAVASAKSDDT